MKKITVEAFERKRTSPHAARAENRVIVKREITVIIVDDKNDDG